VTPQVSLTLENWIVQLVCVNYKCAHEREREKRGKKRKKKREERKKKKKNMNLSHIKYEQTFFTPLL
jgi:hypothetical protein